MNNDLISRQAVIDHINKKREEHLESADLISRQAAILALAEQIMESALMDNPTTASTDINRYRPIAELSLRDVPSAQPEHTETHSCDCERTETHDLVSRGAALEAMDTWDKFGCDPDGKLVRYDDDKHYVPYVHYEDMVHAVKNLPSAQPESKREWYMHGYRDAQRWIPVTEALPEKDGQYVVCSDGYVSPAIYHQRGVYDGNVVWSDYHWTDLETGIIQQIEAWMPLPEPWRGGQDDR